MMKKILLLVVLLLTLLNAKAQKGAIFVEMNYNTFSHSQLKDLQKDQLALNSSFPLEINDDYSSNIGFTLGYKIDSQFAAYFSYSTTGGKLSYFDYSGGIRLTQPLKRYLLGGMYTFSLLENCENFRFGFKAFLSYSTMEIISYSKLVNVENSENSEKLEFFTNDFGLGPIITYEQPIWLVKIRFSIAYDIVFNGKLNVKDNDDYYLQDSSGDAVKTGWSGLRFGLGLSVPI